MLYEWLAFVSMVSLLSMNIYLNVFNKDPADSLTPKKNDELILKSTFVDESLLRSSAPQRELISANTKRPKGNSTAASKKKTSTFVDESLLRSSAPQRELISANTKRPKGNSTAASKKKMGPPILTRYAIGDEECKRSINDEKFAANISKGPPILTRYAIGDEECKRSINDEKFAANISKKKTERPDIEVDEKIAVNCEALRSRGYYSDSNSDVFSIAYVRIVYKDYHIQELLFNLMYSPTNIFCYAIDRKASAIFHEQMRNLSQCFSNIHVTVTEYDVDSAGHNMDRSYLECLRLIRKLPRWKYAILLQNYDIPLRTNREMIMILKALNGSNDISISVPFSHRIPKHSDWSYKALQLFKDTSENDNRVLQIAKGSTAASLSRAFAEFVVDKLNLTIILERFNKVPYGVDEMLIPTLNSDDNLDAPGGYTRYCINNHSAFITRYVVWGWSRLPCKSRRYRHNVCVFGLEDLKTLSSSRYLFANKMLPQNDYFAISCWAKRLYNRTHYNHNDRSIDVTFYSRLASVRFNSERQKWRANLKAFNC
ncbi:N-acetyllactosaminide beta-1,6-N-acetylglucosaminyl-transferase, isoform C [Toxocara canis]|uniref:N-acetyllactosaminide beta-1,6-N-acetylglucosaminyl-transferase, isoform C n=1 Tax=Toxocara canis TaxID=6265 RepID=A0A0B2UMS2_TOXCA|nr:N-acetyllactosaminide beta-1,6-N-acetylglucosaminyl-transferase, isoform C [Toxocara canis]